MQTSQETQESQVERTGIAQGEPRPSTPGESGFAPLPSEPYPGQNEKAQQHQDDGPSWRAFRGRTLPSESYTGHALWVDDSMLLAESWVRSEIERVHAKRAPSDHEPAAAALYAHLQTVAPKPMAELSRRKGRTPAKEGTTVNLSRFPAFGTVPTRPRCHYCGGVIVADLHADDDLWEAVMREKFGTGYACINCFASRADEKMIDWAPHVKLIPLSLVGQMVVQRDARTPVARADGLPSNDAVRHAQVFLQSVAGPAGNFHPARDVVPLADAIEKLRGAAAMAGSTRSET